jgi:hypothetical protein
MWLLRDPICLAQGFNGLQKTAKLLLPTSGNIAQHPVMCECTGTAEKQQHHKAQLHVS